MRHQFYADSRDAQKWSIILDAAQKTGSVFWVVMLRPDAPGHAFDAKHGQNYAAVDANPAVAAFFAEERRLGVKDLDRTAQLFQRLGVGLTIFDEAYLASASGQAAYFQKVVAALQTRPATRRDVVFLDPDNGIAGTMAGPEHVRPEQLRLVWQALRAGDLLVVYQHQYRQAGWAEAKREAVEVVTGCPVLAHGTGAVRFFVAVKP
jgi:hypothetical protein